MVRVILVLLMAALWSGSALAQTADKSFRDWTVFTIQQDGARVCYVTSAPISKKGNYKRRGEPYLLVTHRGKDKAEISVSSGYPYKQGSDVKLSVGKKFTSSLFTTDETPNIAWAESEEEDANIVQHMIKGSDLEVRGNSRLGTYSVDTYSLMGFTSAYKRMKSLCE